MSAFDAKPFSRLQHDCKERHGLLLMLTMRGCPPEIDIGHEVDVRYLLYIYLAILIDPK